MLWYARVGLTGTLTDKQALQLAEHELVFMLHTNTQTKTVEVTLEVEADDLDAAGRAALDAVAELDALSDAVAKGKLTARQINIADEATNEQAGSVLSTSGFAARLGVSAPRLDKLKDDIGFPKPFHIPGLPGDLYATADVDRYAKMRGHGGRTGRPRGTDEQDLNSELQLLHDEARHRLSRHEESLLNEAMDAGGPGAVIGKARVLSYLLERYPDLREQLARLSKTFGEVADRADEIRGIRTR